MSQMQSMCDAVLRSIARRPEADRRILLLRLWINLGPVRSNFNRASRVSRLSCDIVRQSNRRTMRGRVFGDQGFDPTDWPTQSPLQGSLGVRCELCRTAATCKRSAVATGFCPSLLVIADDAYCRAAPPHLPFPRPGSALLERKAGSLGDLSRLGIVSSIPIKLRSMVAQMSSRGR